jgi:N-acetyl-anhydromuramyl-L-alanine amidase AmpD
MRTGLEKARAFVRALLVGRSAPALSAQQPETSFSQSSAYHKPRRKIKKVYIHCSASDNPAHDDIKVIRQWHLDRGFNDVGYHFFIKNNGEIEPGRDLEKIPAAQKGHNTGSVAICLHGLNKFNGVQFRALEKLCKEIDRAHGGAVTFHGHCEVSAKDCPVFDYKTLLALDYRGKLGV